jgi:carboxyl-terminal processing protease
VSLNRPSTLGFRYLALFFSLWIGASVSNAQQLDFETETVFDQVWSQVQNDFYQPTQVGESWDQLKPSFRQRAIACTDRDEFASVISEMLATLNSSHTAYFAKTNPKRFQILGVFEWLTNDKPPDLLEYESIGLDVETVEDRVFVRSVYDGLPAHRAGIYYGDEMIRVDGAAFHPTRSFANKAGSKVQVEIRRHESEAIQTIEVEVVRLNGRTMFEQSLAASARILPQENTSLGYVHVWSYAGVKYQDQLKSILLGGKLSQCDGLILDLRDGWGGASLEYLNLFREPVAKTFFKSRDGVPVDFGVAWGKPIVLLINQRTTSGKELFTYGFKKLKLGSVVGEKTAGAVLAGRASLLSNGDVLYLAVSDVLIDGQRLEGIGVEPDIQVPRPMPYACNADPQLDKAIEQLMSVVRVKPEGF